MCHFNIGAVSIHSLGNSVSLSIMLNTALKNFSSTVSLIVFFCPISLIFLWNDYYSDVESSSTIFAFYLSPSPIFHPFVMFSIFLGNVSTLSSIVIFISAIKLLVFPRAPFASEHFFFITSCSYLIDPVVCIPEDFKVFFFCHILCMFQVVSLSFLLH